MAKEIDVRKAAEWDDEEYEFNLRYLQDRGRLKEAKAVELVREKKGAQKSSGFDLSTAKVDDVLDWVGEDADRARTALEAENTRDNPRKTLVEELEAVIDENE